MEPITVDELMTLPKRDFIKRFQKWIKEFNGGKLLKINNPLQCPLNQWVIRNDAKCNRELVPNTAVCPLCGNPCCPDCQNHSVDVISRVTGYLGSVSGWNAAKKQEFEDRHRYDLAGETR